MAKIITLGLHIQTVFHRDAGLPVTPDLIILKHTITRKAQPKAVIAVIGLVAPELVAPAKRRLKSVVGTVRAIILLKEIVAAINVSTLRS